MDFEFHEEGESEEQTPDHRALRDNLETLFADIFDITILEEDLAIEIIEEFDIDEDFDPQNPPFWVQEKDPKYRPPMRSQEVRITVNVDPGTAKLALRNRPILQNHFVVTFNAPVSVSLVRDNDKGIDQLVVDLNIPEASFYDKLGQTDALNHLVHKLHRSFQNSMARGN